jgi:hypothetical protein
VKPTPQPSLVQNAIYYEIGNIMNEGMSYVVGKMYIVAVNFIGGGNRRTGGKPQFVASH